MAQLLRILIHPNDILRKKNEDVVIMDEDFIVLIANMIYTMRQTSGVGLAAPQVGKNLRFFVMKEDNKTPIVIINPTILEASKETFTSKEGCLSCPFEEANIERPQTTIVSFYNLKGEKKIRIFEGKNSAIFHHENDHLNGVLIVDNKEN